MSEWWSSLTNLQQIYWGFAIPFSLIFLIQMIMTFVAGDLDAEGPVDTDIEADHGAGFQFFTLKNFVGFFTLFAWTGLACLESGFSEFSSLMWAFFAGLGMMVLMAAIFYYFSQLSDSGTLSINNAIGGVGQVYLPIKASRENIGKVQIKVQGSLRELEAISDDEQDLQTGTVVSVIDVINNNTLVVTKSKK
ncbi:hypothetical protein [Marinoscillum sp. MHG1-6]|uniref:hypothetical protein n=1 Tax=Marinoscillum sp. MHG1-6 TaxID=2959627 RepID=UPI00215788DD|nr:hypothetical protein [Marinoscillum sp. MHG1-6]